MSASSNERQVRYQMCLFLLKTRYQDFELLTPASSLKELEPQHAEPGTRLHEMLSFWGELKRMPLDELSKLCAQTRYDARMRSDRERHLADHLLDVDYPKANADYDWWVKHDYLTLDESAALLLGKDPRAIDVEYLMKHPDEYEFARQFVCTREMLRRAQSAGRLFEEIIPRDLLEWGHGKFDCTALREAVVKAGANEPSLQERYEDIKKKYDKLLSEEDLRGSMRGTYFTILYAVATANYGYKRGGVRNSAAARISSAVLQTGLSISEETVKNHLTMAETHLESDLKAQN